MAAATGRFLQWVLGGLLSLVLLTGSAGAAAAFGLADVPEQPPENHVLDGANLLSRAGQAEIERQLAGFLSDRVDARLITVSHLDYDLSLERLGHQVLERWNAGASAREAASALPRLLLLIDSQTRTAAVVVDPTLGRQLPSELLRSTAGATMEQPMREGERYRQATMDALQRLSIVLNGGEDPGGPLVAEETTVVSNIPSKEETASSNASTWVLVLLAVGAVIPMVTWWIFSR